MQQAGWYASFAPVWTSSAPLKLSVDQLLLWDFRVDPPLMAAEYKMESTAENTRAYVLRIRWAFPLNTNNINILEAVAAWLTNIWEMIYYVVLIAK